MKGMSAMPRVRVSQVVPAPVGRVWKRVRDFGELGNWHPGMSEGRIEDDRPPDQIGVVRTMQAEGATFRERLVSMSDLEHFHEYTMIDSPLPLRNYRGRFELIPISEPDHTLIQWSSTFDAPDDQTEELIGLVKDVYRTGLNHLRDEFS